MKAQHLDEDGRALLAKLRVLVDTSKVSFGKISIDLVAAASACPDLGEGVIAPLTEEQQSQYVYRWPAAAHRELGGVAICHAILSRTGTPALKALKEQNNKSYEGSRALFNQLWNDDYWQFTVMLNANEKIRKNTAIQYGLSACYIWPKSKSQFAYATRSKQIIDSCPERDCLGVVGAFTIHAPPEATPTVSNGKAFYVLATGQLLERGSWRSRIFAINNAEFVILYELTSTSSNHYSGLITVGRSDDDVAVAALSSPHKHIGGTRAFRGQFNTLRIISPEDFGEFYCEELDGILSREGDIRALLSAAAKGLIGQLNWLDFANPPAHAEH